MGRSALRERAGMRLKLLVALVVMMATLCVAEDVVQARASYDDDSYHHRYDGYHGKYDGHHRGGYHEDAPDRRDDHGRGHYPTIPAPSVTDVSPNGQTYSELAQIFWQWIFRYNSTYSPLAASNPADCNFGVVAGGDVLIVGGVVGQPGDAFSLTRNCFLTKRVKSIFIPLLNSEEDTNPSCPNPPCPPCPPCVGDRDDVNKPGGFLRPDSFPNGQLRALTASVYLRVFSGGRELHIPGWPHSAEHQSQFIKDNFYVATPYFPLVVPKNSSNTFEDEVLLAATTGYYVLLDVEHVHFPLTLQFGGQLVVGNYTFTLAITYNIHAPDAYRREGY